ncbi:MAG TPA: hypothetical protein V6D33_01340 [Cyanophyceae cyanobacterium]
MNSRLPIRKTAFSKLNSTPAPNPFLSRPFENGVNARQSGLSASTSFESRPFSVQTQQELSSLQPHETPDTEQQQEKVKRLGYDFAEVSVSAGAIPPPDLSKKSLLQPKFARYDQNSFGINRFESPLWQRTKHVVQQTGLIQRTLTLEDLEDKLSYGLFDWAITDKEAHDVIAALSLMDAATLQETIVSLGSTKINRLLDNLPSSDRTTYASTISRLKNIHVRDVRETVSETISNAPPPYGAWNNSFTWDSNFHLILNQNTRTLTVSVRIFSNATKQQKQAWEDAIESKWSQRYKLVVASKDTSTPPAEYPIIVDLQWVAQAKNADYTVNPSSTGSTSGGRSGQGGTTSMTDWGTTDTVDITHEFGHMLGNPEEYFTTNGHDYTQGGTRRGFRDAGGGVMNNPTEDPFAQHYELIRRHAASILGVPNSQCTVQNYTPPSKTEGWGDWPAPDQDTQYA